MSSKSTQRGIATANVDVAAPKGRAADTPTSEGYEPLHDASIYDSTVDPLAENNAHSLVVRLTGEHKRVLELGCSTGSTTKVLSERGCRVVGIEIDADAAQIAQQFSERVIVADLDLLDVGEALGDDTFDVIIAADVLEHLRDPRRVMKACIARLRPEGEVVLSIPNIAHADARLALLRGDFDYQTYGILDETHMRFFTRRTLTAFLDDCGLVALEWERTHRSIGETEIEWRSPHDEALVDWVARQPDADTYQFILRAAAAPDGSHLRELGARLHQLETLTAADNETLTAHNETLTADNDWLRSRTEELMTQIEGLSANIALLTADNEALVLSAAEKDAEASVVIAELQATVDVVQERHNNQLVSTRTEMAAVERQLQERAEELHELEGERDRYRSSFEALVGVQEELVAVRRSESFRLGRGLLAPGVAGRRIARAWRRAKPSR